MSAQPLDWQPDVYPVCPTCGEPATYKRGINFNTGGFQWAWFRSCNHRVGMVLNVERQAEEE